MVMKWRESSRGEGERIYHDRDREKVGKEVMPTTEKKKITL